jgi:transcriptional regulator with XRE-family HTH domain
MTSFQVQSALKQLGHDIRTARKKRRLSVSDFCLRIGVTDKTLAKLEHGNGGGVRLETFAMALLALGELHRLTEMLDPAKDNTGLVLDNNRLPERISSPRRKTTLANDLANDPPAMDDEGSAF